VYGLASADPFKGPQEINRATLNLTQTWTSPSS
jgi:hypothetical protein